MDIDYIQKLDYSFDVPSNKIANKKTNQMPTKKRAFQPFHNDLTRLSTMLVQQRRHPKCLYPASEYNEFSGFNVFN